MSHNPGITNAPFASSTRSLGSGRYAADEMDSIRRPFTINVWFVRTAPMATSTTVACVRTNRTSRGCWASADNATTVTARNSDSLRASIGKRLGSVIAAERIVLRSPHENLAEERAAINPHACRLGAVDSEFLRKPGHGVARGSDPARQSPYQVDEAPRLR